MHWKIHPPRPSRFPSGGDFAPLGPRDCPRASPSGNLSGLGVQNPPPREISRASGGVFSNTSRLEAVYGHSFIIIREVLIFCCDNRWRCYQSSFVWKKNLLICNHSRELLLLGDPFLPLNRPYLYSICRYWIKIQLHSLSKSGKIEFCPFCTRAQPSWVDELLHRLVLRRGARDRGTIS